MPDRSRLVQNELRSVGWVTPPYSVSFLAAGEYNENYLVETDAEARVFRINHGTQLGIDNQIEYEYSVLTAVAPSGVTPRPLHVCRSSDAFPRGYLLMEYLPGRSLDYNQDAERAAVTFARIHAIPASAATAPLISQPHPVRDILTECDGLLARAHDHAPAARTSIERYREEVVRPLTDHSFAPDTSCIVNTEVNSGNFLVDGEAVRLVDWEKAVWSLRYQDLGHFLVSTTTLWKSDYRFDPEAREAFLRAYRASAAPPVSLEELDMHTGVLEQTILLRALSWVYMAVGEYERTDRPIKNASTYRTMKRYLSEVDSFLVVR